MKERHLPDSSGVRISGIGHVYADHNIADHP